MNLRFLDMGMAGVLEASLIALAAGIVALLLVHVVVGRRLRWSHGKQIGWAYLFTLLTACSADIWNLVYMGIVPMQSPVTIQRVLSGIHDPDYLGMRVVGEVVAAGLGVMLGWLLVSGPLRRRGRRRSERRSARQDLP
ncbi:MULTISPECIES: hypothetical protein [Oleiagrimonas]|uniref:Uncharacterized protein n=1 Tax=Oleiagrimonas citrea TaxID=1665687 RepID=A0A846ZLA5_9GAMM|nr:MULTISPECIES: hypothetical protein [Oleiagrimonas]NKZ38379.1 hypothetical protein [Oleiagrimonas citrea]RAP58356.1 hypothetical protein BTJ49_05240 [Oleiagrimonas sp. MCCC 1A03011]